MNKIIAGIVAIPLLIASMPNEASALSGIVNPEVQKPQVGTLPGFLTTPLKACASAGEK